MKPAYFLIMAGTRSREALFWVQLPLPMRIALVERAGQKLTLFRIKFFGTVTSIVNVYISDLVMDRGKIRKHRK